MSRDAKDPRHKPDGVRQPQRKDSLTSILSWAALQGKITPKTTATSSSVSAQTSPGNSTKPRRHSHSASTETKPKARRGSAFRRLSFSISTTIQEEPSTKTRRAKTPMTPDAKASPGSSKAGKNGSSEKVNKPSSETPDGKGTRALPTRPQSAQDKPRPSASPPPMPKSILRVSSPDGHRRPPQFVNPDTGEPSTIPNLPPSLPDASTDSPSGSPPTSPISRPMSPGTTVRFAKATIHRVDILSPSRRRFLLPVRRKSKSTLTYISPLDPGGPGAAQKGSALTNPLKTVLQKSPSPTKLRRHQENQAAMGRYWMRTEEEEAEWRAEAERRAAEEAERYRREPASPPPPPPPCSMVSGEGEGKGVSGEDEGGGSTLTEKVVEIDKVSSLDGGAALDKVEEVVESEDEDEKAGAKCNLGEELECKKLKGPQEPKSVTGGSRGAQLEADKGIKELKSQEMLEQIVVTEAVEDKAPPSVSVEAKKEARDTNQTAPTSSTTTIPATAVQELAEKPATTAPTSATPPPAPTAEEAKLAESRTFFEKLAEEQAVEERGSRASYPTTLKADSQNTESSTAQSNTDRHHRSSAGSLLKDNSGGASTSGRSSSTSTSTASASSSKSSTSSSARPARVSSRERLREREREKEKEKSKAATSTSTSTATSSNSKSSPTNPRLGGSSSSSSSKSDRTDRSDRTSRGHSNNSHSHSHGSSSGRSSNHLHLSGRRGRRYFEGQKQGIMA